MYSSRLNAALPSIREQVAEAALRSGRDPSAVTLVAVTKGHPPEVIEACLEHGLLDLGENRVEALEERVPAFAGRGIRWHMIGRLQSRKATRAAELSHWVHSVDSERLAARLDRGAAEAGVRLPVLIQVNTAGEESKTGFEPEEAVAAVERLITLPHLAVRGLMTMAPFTEDESIVRGAFRSLRLLHEQLRDTLSGYEGTELSMGMSNDFGIAIEEGSTLIRLGTVLFGERAQGNGGESA